MISTLLILIIANSCNNDDEKEKARDVQIEKAAKINSEKRDRESSASKVVNIETTDSHTIENSDEKNEGSAEEDGKGVEDLVKKDPIEHPKQPEKKADKENENSKQNEDGHMSKSSSFSTDTRPTSRSISGSYINVDEMDIKSLESSINDGFKSPDTNEEK